MVQQERKIRFVETVVGGSSSSFSKFKDSSEQVPIYKESFQPTDHSNDINANGNKILKRKSQYPYSPTPKRYKLFGSCDRCRHRKKKCDGKDGGSCSSCLSSNNECTYSKAAHREAKRNDSISEPLCADSNDNSNAGSNVSENSTPLQEGQPISSTSKISGSTNPIPSVMGPSEIEKSNAPNSVCKSIAEGRLYTSITMLLNDRREDSYIGSTAIIHKVNLIRNSIASKVYKSHQCQLNLHDPDGLLKTQDPVHVEIPANTEEKLEKAYVTHYTKLISQRYFCYEDTDLLSLFPDCFERKLKKGTISSISTKDENYKKSVSNLILALGCRLYKLSRGVNNVSPKIYFERAIEQISSIESSLQIIDQIRLLMFISVYLFYSYDNSINFAIKVWGLTGLATRKVTQIGLHRFEVPSITNSREYESKKRLFWSIYTFERILCLILGRATSLSDEEIDVPYALNINSLEEYSDSELYNMQMTQQLQQCESGDHRIIHPKNIGDTFYLIQLSKLREIETCISRLERHLSMPIPQSFAKDLPHKNHSSTFEKVAQDLENWKNQLPKESEFNEGMKNQVNYEYLTLAYYRAKTLLCLTKITRKEYIGEQEFHALLHQVSDAAGGICKSFLVIAKGSAFSYGMFSLHTIFLSGILLAYSIVTLGSLDSRSPNGYNLWKYHNYLRHCSVLLSIFAERTRKAASFRVLFDELLEHGVYSNYPETSPSEKDTEIALESSTTYASGSNNLQKETPSSLLKDNGESEAKKEMTILNDLMDIFIDSEFQADAICSISDEDDICKWDTEY